jgi:hypothetical protein
VLDDILSRVVSHSAPGLFSGRLLHRAGLAAAAAGRHARADRLFESAASTYRQSLDVEGLARLRVHQRMTRARAARDSVREAELMLEIVRGLNRLDRLESFHAPHEMKDARTVLSEWLSDSGAVLEADPEGARIPA